MSAFPGTKRLFLGAAVALVLFSAGLARGQEPRPNCYVLAVGVDAYASPKVNDLHGCVNDARTAAQVFRRQQGKIFGKVQSWTLTDARATRANIHRIMDRLRGTGKAGDYVVLFLSGHGSRQPDGQWYFIPHDYDPANPHATGLTDSRVLGLADALASKGKKVVVLIDACFAGQLRLRGWRTLNRYQDPAGGGIVLMLSSMPGQTSAALGRYSAFALAVAEGLTGRADLNHDGKVTLGEVRRYAYVRVHEMLREKGLRGEQDGECDYSPSLSDGLVLAAAGQETVALEREEPEPVGRRGGAEDSGKTVWTGSEDLAGYGKLTFELDGGGGALMIDTRARTRGTWSRSGREFEIRFPTCVYRGRLTGQELAGTARSLRANNNTTWSFRVALQLD